MISELELERVASLLDSGEVGCVQMGSFYETIIGMAETLAANTSIKQQPVLAFFDESGKWKDPVGVFVFGGLTIFPTPFQKLMADWSKRLQQDGLAFTSMKEAIHCHGPYWKYKDDQKQRNGILRDLAQMLIGSPGVMHIASPMRTATIEAFKALPHKERESMGNDPYYGAFEACILGCLNARSDTTLHLICDLAEEYSEKCVKALHRMRQIKPPIRERCPGVTFCDDEKHPGLQMADMIAYCERAGVLKAIGKDLPDPVIEELMEILLTNDPEEHHVSYKVHGDLGGLGEGTLAPGPIHNG